MWVNISHTVGLFGVGRFALDSEVSATAGSRRKLVKSFLGLPYLGCPVAHIQHKHAEAFVARNLASSSMFCGQKGKKTWHGQVCLTVARSCS